MRTYLFTEGSILEVEEEAEHGGDAADVTRDLNIGTLRNRGKDLP
jgi:hypothetical protein